MRGWESAASGRTRTSAAMSTSSARRSSGSPSRMAMPPDPGSTSGASSASTSRTSETRSPRADRVGRDDLLVPDADGFWLLIQMSDGAFADPVKIGPATELDRIYGADGYR